MKRHPLATLDSVARILTGYTFRTRIEDDPGGSFRVIQGKDIRPDGSLEPAHLTRIHLPERSGSGPGKWVKRGDVLLMVRGDRNYAALVDADLPPTVTQNSFCTLRVLDPGILSPDYLATILNQPLVQSRLMALRSGTSIANITFGALKQLAIPLPPLAVQSEIVALARAIHLEKDLFDRLHAARLRQLDALATSL